MKCNKQGNGMSDYSINMFGYSLNKLYFHMNILYYMVIQYIRFIPLKNRYIKMGYVKKNSFNSILLHRKKSLHAKKMKIKKVPRIIFL